MTLRGGRLARHLPTVGKLVGAMLSLVAAAFLGAYFSSYYNAQDAADLAYRQQKISEIQQYRVTGVALNAAFRAFNDALVDEQEARLADSDQAKALAGEVISTRKALRDAIGQHSSQAYSARAVLGPGSGAYLERLAGFRRLVDKVQAPPDAMPMAQAGLNLVQERESLATSAERRLGFDPTKS